MSVIEKRAPHNYVTSTAFLRGEPSITPAAPQIPRKTFSAFAPSSASAVEAAIKKCRLFALVIRTRKKSCSLAAAKKEIKSKWPCPLRLVVAIMAAAGRWWCRASNNAGVLITRKFLYSVVLSALDNVEEHYLVWCGLCGRETIGPDRTTLLVRRLTPFLFVPRCCCGLTRPLETSLAATTLLS
jgi:hypothetical protein